VKDQTVFNLVKELTELAGPIGREEQVQEWIHQSWDSFAKAVEVSRVQNIVANMGGDGPRILLAAHADEICFMVKSISPEGLIFLSPHNADSHGRPPAGLFPFGQTAVILGNKGVVPGVFTSKTGHALGPQKWDKGHTLAWNDIYVETGAGSDGELEERGVHPGCRIIWNPPTRQLGPLLYGKAMDDRALLAILTLLGQSLASSKLRYETYLGSTVQEEIGLVGASSITSSREYDLAIALDIGLSSDIPGVSERDIPTQLGKGPVLLYQDSTVHYDYGFTEHLADIATENDIPFQRTIYQNYACDGEMFIRAGIPTAMIALPARYTHSPFEMIHIEDLKHAVELLQAFLYAKHFQG
jgi:endoglucanase